MRWQTLTPPLIAGLLAATLATLYVAGYRSGYTAVVSILGATPAVRWQGKT